MLQSELMENGRRIRHWSDTGMMIRQEETGVLYEDAVDVAPCRYTYTETEEPIEKPEEEMGAPDEPSVSGSSGETTSPGVGEGWPPDTGRPETERRE